MCIPKHLFIRQRTFVVESLRWCITVDHTTFLDHDTSEWSGSPTFLLELFTSKANHRLDRIHVRQHLDARRIPAGGLFRGGERFAPDPRHLSLLQPETHAEAGPDAVHLLGDLWSAAVGLVPQQR